MVLVFVEKELSLRISVASNATRDSNGTKHLSNANAQGSVTTMNAQSVIHWPRGTKHRKNVNAYHQPTWSEKAAKYALQIQTMMLRDKSVNANQTILAMEGYAEEVDDQH